MKKKLLLLVLGLIATTQMIHSQAPSYVPTSGLVGYWDFNGNANDQSGNNNNGTVNGATLTTDRFGNSSSAYSFNGISDNISIPNSTSLSNMTSITISAWFNINQWKMINNQGWFPILSKTNSSSYGKYRLGAYTNGGQPSIYGNLSTDASGISQSNLYSLNQWNQIVITISNGNSTVSINGVQVFKGSTVLTGWSTVDNLPLLIGKDIPGIVDYANGKIDDIGIWNRVLSESEITAMYNGVNYSDTCNAVSGSLVNGLVAYYPFCGNANDQSGNEFNGTVNGATLTTDRFGNANGAYNFNGVSNYINLSNSIYGISGNSDRSIVAWIKTTSQGYKAIFSTGTGVSGNPCTNNGKTFNMKLGNNKLSLMSYNCGTCSSCDFYPNTGINISDNIWHNVIVVLKNNIIYTYVDGKLDNTASMPNINTTGNSNFIGKDNHIGVEDYFEGLIDDIGIWNRALSPQEITKLFNQNQCFTNISVTDTMIINVGQLSYTNPVTYANNITIYPNPANTQVNISFNNIADLTGGHIKIVNSLGQQVATTPITLSGTNTTLGLNTWGGAGLYLVQIINAQGVVVDVKKIILQ